MKTTCATYSNRIMKSTNAIIAAEFAAPPFRFRKDDPRGSGYGHFSCIALDDEKIEVTKHDVFEQNEYTFVMSVESFLAWAEDCT
jgi:hypothetical protein